MNFSVVEVPKSQTDWQDKAACRAADNAELFFPNSFHEVRMQGWKVYCNSCPVKRQCADSATPNSVGIYGGEPVGIGFSKPPGRPRSKQKPLVSKVPQPMFRAALGTVIRQKRVAEGMRLHELAEASFISKSMMSETERGIKEMSSDNLNLVARALGVPLSTIIYEAGMLLEIAELAGVDVP